MFFFRLGSYSSYDGGGLPHAPVPAGPTFTTATSQNNTSINNSFSTPTPYSANKTSSLTTSTPLNPSKAQAHVTFSESVIEISDSPPRDGDSGKKVPPPPPPRKSSRVTFKAMSPTHGQPSRPFSPPAYVNIENLNINVSGSSDAAAKQATPSPPGMTSIHNRSASEPVPMQGAIAQLGTLNQGHVQKQKPMSKFHQELAAGIYANMNRPDLQGQKVNPVNMVNDPNLNKDDSVLKDFSDNESTASSQDSQAGLARRMLAAKLDQENNPTNGQMNNNSSVLRQSPPKTEQDSQPKVNGLNSSQLNTSGIHTSGVKMRDGKRVPPPPPIRRTSQLSSKAQQNESPLTNGGDNMPVEEKRRSVSELQKEILQQMGNPQTKTDRNNGTPERTGNGVLPHQQQSKPTMNGDIIRTDASFAISRSSSKVTTQTSKANGIKPKQGGKRGETDIY